MKFGWKLLLTFYLPLHFAFGCFYIADFLQRPKSNGEGGFSFDENYTLADLSFYSWLEFGGFGLILLSLFLPPLIIYRNYQTKLTKPTKIFD